MATDYSQATNRTLASSQKLQPDIQRNGRQSNTSLEIQNSHKTRSEPPSAFANSVAAHKVEISAACSRVIFILVEIGIAVFRQDTSVVNNNEFCLFD